MSYIALYRKWRPSVFEDVVEQEHVVKTLKNSVVNDRVAHAYLFCGTRGTGKTTMAHIFSRAINCENPSNGDPCNECEVCKGILAGSLLDVIEIDAASNNSVDNVREIRDEVIYAPSKAKYKVYIIDEVHMLSGGAFNALLKTLEEPPRHVVFILATTEPHKLPATILSRCQRFDFRRISIQRIVERIQKIATAGDVQLGEEAARLIAKMSEGALRDAISILDQCISIGNKEISYNDVLSVVGLVNDSFIGDVVDAIAAKDTPKLLRNVDALVMEGKDITKFTSDLVWYFRNLLLCKITDNPQEIIEASDESIQRMKNQEKAFGQDGMMYMIKELSALESNLKWATHPRILLEVSLIKLAESDLSLNSEDLLERVIQLEKRIERGEFAIQPPVQTRPEVQKGKEPQKEQKEPDKPAIQEKQVYSKGIGVQAKELGFWPETIQEFKNSGRMVIYTNLIGTTAVMLDEKVVGIVFTSGSGFKKMLVSKAENLEYIQEVLARKLGKEVKAKCINQEDLHGGSAESPAEEKDELIEKAEDIARRLNAPLNIVDE